MGKESIAPRKIYRGQPKMGSRKSRYADRVTAET